MCKYASATSSKISCSIDRRGFVALGVGRAEPGNEVGAGGAGAGGTHAEKKNRALAHPATNVTNLVLRLFFVDIMVLSCWADENYHHSVCQ